MYGLPIKIALDWQINFHHAPLLIALEKGYFAEQGLDVTLHTFQSSTQACLLLGAGAYQFALTNGVQIDILNSKRIDLEIVSVLIDKPLEVIVSSLPFTSENIRGKILVHSSSHSASFTFSALKTFLSYYHVQQGEVDVLLSKHTLLTPFLAGHVDIIFNVYHTSQLYDLQKYSSQPLYIKTLAELGITPRSGLVMVTHRTVDSVVKNKMKQALKKAYQYILAHPKNALECILNRYSALRIGGAEKLWQRIWPCFAQL